MRDSGLVVAVAGATGLVGSELVRQLSETPGVAEVRALVRRPVELNLPRVKVCNFDFADPEKSRHLLEVDHIYSGLGTPIRVVTDEAAVREVDYGAMLAVARLAKAGGARHFLTVSTLQAGIDSKILYCRIKGEAENELIRLGFPSLTIARPSFLWGPRGDFRLPERVGGFVAFVLPTPWRTIHASRVARALILTAQEGKPGVHVLDNRTLLQLTAR